MIRGGFVGFVEIAEGTHLNLGVAIQVVVRRTGAGDFAANVMFPDASWKTYTGPEARAIARALGHALGKGGADA
jgi:hypothetical protein